MPPRLRAVLFDAHGTLLVTARPVGETYADCAGRQDVRIPAWRWTDALARVLAGAEPMAFPELAPEAIPAREREWWRQRVRETVRAADSQARFPDFEAFFAALWEHFARADAWRPLPGAREALAALRERGLRTAVASNFDGRLPGILAGLEIAPLLDAVLLPAQLGTAKPDARFFERALARVGAAAAEAVYVGDDAARDLAAARAAGLRAVGVDELATLAELPARLAALETVP